MSVMSNGHLDLSVAEAAYGKRCDLYRDVLVVEPNASAHQIQDAYFARRKHLFQVLSDLEQQTSGERRSKQSELQRRRAERKMDAVVSAVRILGDAELRQRYDELLVWRNKEVPSASSTRRLSSVTSKKRRSTKQQTSLSQSSPVAVVPELPGLHDTSNSSANITEEYSTSHEISDNDKDEQVVKQRVVKKAGARVAFRSPPDTTPPPQQQQRTKRSAGDAGGRMKQPSRNNSSSRITTINSTTTRAATSSRNKPTGRGTVLDETESNGSGSLLLLSDTEEEEEEEDLEEDLEEGTTLCSATVYDDEEIRGRGSLPSSKRPEGLLDRIRMEFLGALDDTSRSFEQVFHAFTLQEEDIDAVVRRIDKAKLQIIHGPNHPVGATTSAATAADHGTSGSNNNNNGHTKQSRARRK
jgi:hypothetical protein